MTTCPNRPSTWSARLRKRSPRRRRWRRRRKAPLVAGMAQPPVWPVSIKGVCLVGGKVVLLKNERDEWELPGGPGGARGSGSLPEKGTGGRAGDRGRDRWPAGLLALSGAPDPLGADRDFRRPADG